MAGATIGQRFTTATGTFSVVADDLREKTEVQLHAELTSTGLFGSTQATTTVLDQTFNDVDLVGRPLTSAISSAPGASASCSRPRRTRIHPILLWGRSVPRPEPRRGDSWYELSGGHHQFPFSSQILTGVFLKVTLSGPQDSRRPWSGRFSTGSAMRQGRG